jgi:PIN domain nuclease of toxin-antitoxin system
MRILLDTHTFLWYCIGNNRLSYTAKTLIEDKKIQPLLSVASLWEIAIKLSLGKLRLNQSFEKLIPDQLQQNGIDCLPLEMRHFISLIDLPFHHRDPFDRLLIAQALAESMPLLSADAVLDAYPIKRLW